MRRHRMLLVRPTATAKNYDWAIVTVPLVPLDLIATPWHDAPQQREIRKLQISSVKSLLPLREYG